MFFRDDRLYLLCQIPRENRTFDRRYGFALGLLLGGDVESGVYDRVFSVDLGRAIGANP